MKLLAYSGSISITGSKSIIQRALIIAAVQPMNLILYPASRCDDVKELITALDRTCGSVKYIGDYIQIITTGKKLPATLKKPVVFKGSATAFRFWLAFCALKFQECEIEISPQLAARPHQPLFDALKQLGFELTFYTIEHSLMRSRKAADIHYKKIQPKTKYDKVRRIKMTRAHTSKKMINIDSSLSSQFTSALMLVGSYFEAGLKLNLAGDAVSSDYVHLTAELMNDFGNKVKLTPKAIQMSHTQGFKPKHQYLIEPDMSSAAFFLCLGAFSQIGVSLECRVRTRWQPDWAILEILRKMGVSVIETGNLITAKSGTLKGIRIDMNSNPDLVPLLAVMALFADDSCTFENIAHLQYKESDRLKGITIALDKIQAKYKVTGSSLTIFPYAGNPDAVKLDTQKDHRLVMAFTLLQLHFPQITISETASVTKSCPEFPLLLNSLRRNGAPRII